jgi:hypothetical protein
MVISLFLVLLWLLNKTNEKPDYFLVYTYQFTAVYCIQEPVCKRGFNLG